MESEKKIGRPKDPNSKRSRGVDRHKHPRKVFHLPLELLEALEDYASNGRKLSHSEVVRNALEQYLASMR